VVFGRSSDAIHSYDRRDGAAGSLVYGRSPDAIHSDHRRDGGAGSVVSGRSSDAIIHSYHRGDGADPRASNRACRGSSCSARAAKKLQRRLALLQTMFTVARLKGSYVEDNVHILDLDIEIMTST